jgi:hypothetical protein
MGFYKDVNLENYIPISANALKLSLSSHLLTLISGELDQNAEKSLASLMDSVMKTMVDGNKDDLILMGYINFISKFTNNDELEVITAQAMIDAGDSQEVRDQIATNPEEFMKLGREEQFSTLFKFLLAMDIDVEKGYKELDEIEAQANL